MKIVVCIKQIIHTYARTGRNPESLYLSKTDQIKRINPYDEAALDIALNLKEENRNHEIILLTLGPVLIEEQLRRCLALGADHLYRIDHPADTISREKANILAQAALSFSPDLILCGKQSKDHENGVVPGFMAHALNLPFVAGIEALELTREMVGAALKNSGRGVKQVIETGLPALFSVDLGASAQRMPTGSGMQKALAAPIHQFDLNIDVAARHKTAHSVISVPCPRTKRTLVPDYQDDSFYRVRQLLTASRVKKKGRVLTGSPETQITELMSFLRDKKLIDVSGRNQVK